MELRQRALCPSTVYRTSTFPVGLTSALRACVRCRTDWENAKVFESSAETKLENQMYIGGGLLGLVLIIVLVVYLL
jgi:hypothetical protein